jgi:16S rRNA (adenine1518-N6/adenine1519-N6)-dimethyltransferase
MVEMVKPKKHLGQHFLINKDIAESIVNQVSLHKGYQKLLEVGPGMGVLTDFLIQNKQYETYLMEIDTESVAFLHHRYPQLQAHTIEGDFLEWDLKQIFQDEIFGIIGNFPYNISSQIFFKVLEYKDQIPEIVCMLQKEVAERLASPPKKKDYGILSVLLQAYYDIEYLFTVEPHEFNPPPKVRSGVIRVKRNEVEKLDCDEKKFKMIVKQGFNNRRKTLRNALKSLNLPEHLKENEILNKRAEELSVTDFVYLTNEFMKEVV